MINQSKEIDKIEFIKDRCIEAYIKNENGPYTLANICLGIMNNTRYVPELCLDNISMFGEAAHRDKKLVEISLPSLTNIVPERTYWKLYNDDLEDQDEDCIDFIYSVLSKYKNE